MLDGDKSSLQSCNIRAPNVFTSQVGLDGRIADAGISSTLQEAKLRNPPTDPILPWSLNN